VRLYYNNKNVCFRIRVTFENQNLMTQYIENTFSPVFQLKNHEHYALKFEYKKFFCSHLKTKREFLYKDIQRIEIIASGVIIYLKSKLYISISVGHSENHNTELYDIITLLKRRCPWRFKVKEPISYPEIESDYRYKTDKEPLLQTSFSLTDTEIKRLIWYNYLFGEKRIVFLVFVLTFALWAAVWQSLPLALIAVFGAVSGLVPSKFVLENRAGFIQNHQGQLHLALYDDLLVVRLRSTDLDLEYDSMKCKKSVFGLWRLKCSEFFVFILPNRVVKENPVFFDRLCAKIKKE